MNKLSRTDILEIIIDNIRNRPDNVVISTEMKNHLRVMREQFNKSVELRDSWIETIYSKPGNIPLGKEVLVSKLLVEHYLTLYSAYAEHDNDIITIIMYIISYVASTPDGIDNSDTLLPFYKRSYGQMALLINVVFSNNQQEIDIDELNTLYEQINNQDR